MKSSCLIAFIATLGGFSLSSRSQVSVEAFPFMTRRKTNISVSSQLQVFLHMTKLGADSEKPVDDDDISQETYMLDKDSNLPAPPSNSTKYRSIEDWHENDIANNPTQALDRLKSERAQWAKKFEDVGGDGV